MTKDVAFAVYFRTSHLSAGGQKQGWVKDEAGRVILHTKADAIGTMVALDKEKNGSAAPHQRRFSFSVSRYS